MQGGALFILHSAHVAVSNTSFLYNTALHGGAVAAAGTVGVNVSGSTFAFNTVHALEFEGGVLASISASSFDRNNGSTSDGGALSMGDTSFVTVSATNFTANSGTRLVRPWPHPSTLVCPWCTHSLMPQLWDATGAPTRAGVSPRDTSAPSPPPLRGPGSPCQGNGVASICLARMRAYACWTLDLVPRQWQCEHMQLRCKQH